MTYFGHKFKVEGQFIELPLLCSIEQSIHPEVLQERDKFRGMDGVFPHPEEVRSTGAI
jgi:hypothetical protein